ncbi:adhesion G-protein coupled receptor G1 [Genypterus blacodes]|uniref:adhesion G-protein coupled receptor G1 n=1 Tax=Genypterus blacodes TaxID=154954 RepID=UPI003F76BB57
MPFKHLITMICIFLFMIGSFSTTLAVYCENVPVIEECYNKSWTRCYEDQIANCLIRGRLIPSGFIRRRVNSSHKVEESPSFQHRVHIPSSALQRSRGAVPVGSEEDVLLIITLLNSSLFDLAQGRALTPETSTQRKDDALTGFVVVVKAGRHSVSNLTQPIRLIFKNNKQEQKGTCVFWKESEMEDKAGSWSTEGCGTSYNENETICSCNHLSFFAVLVNPRILISQTDAVNLTYITYIGSALSVIFSIITLIIYICLQRQHQEKAIGVHIHLTGALLCLHLSFVLSNLWALLRDEDEDKEGWVCGMLGLSLHWSLLATFSWMALEGFHLYLLLVKVFNIYVRRYLLKLSMVGWGLPTLIAVVCGICGVYGKFTLVYRDATNQTATGQICWISSDFPQSSVVSYVTVVAFLGLVVLGNSCMLGLVVMKMWRLRQGSSGWKRLYKENAGRVWKDCATVLGLSSVLGLPWALAGSTYYSFSLPGIYLFTTLNALQGVFMFLWSLALTCKSQPDNNSSAKDPSSQKMIETSFNN